jgi:hypothetical protein
MRSQTDIDALLKQLMDIYNGLLVDYWGYPGECLSYAKRWLDTLRNGVVNGPMAAPASPNGYGDGYYSAPPLMVKEYFEADLQPYDHNADYPAGSLFTYSGSHHIGILLNNNPGQPYATVSHQNANPDHSPVHTGQRDKTKIDGILPIRVARPAAPYTMTVQPFPSRDRYKVRPGMQKWDLDQPNFQAIKDNPIGHAGDDTYIWVTDWLTRSDLPQYTYYLEDGSKHQGWNRNDLELSPIPYVPPAPPISATPVEFYTLITNVMRFSSPTDALHHQNYQGDLTEGQYIVIAKQEKAYNLSDDNMKDRGWWINIDDNRIPDPTPPAPQQDTDIVHPEVEPVDFPATIEQPKIVSHSLRADGAVVMYQATNSQPIEIKDYQTGREPITMQPYNYSSETGKNAPVPLVSTFTVERYRVRRTQKVAKAGWFYGVPMSALELYELPEATVAVHTQPGIQYPVSPASIPTRTVK